MSLLEAWISVAVCAAALHTSGPCKENGKFLLCCPNLNQIAPLSPNFVTFFLGGSPFSSHLSPFCLLSLNEAMLAGRSLSYY